MNKAELTLLLTGERIQTKTIFPDQSCLSFCLSSFHHKMSVLLKRDGNIFFLEVNRELLVDLANKAPAKEGIAFLLESMGQTPLKITIELDIFT